MSDFLEKTLEDIIYENQDTIHERGFPSLHNNTYRQFPLPSGRFIDLLSFTIEKNVIYISLFELKKENLNIDSLLQLLSYGSEVRVLCSPHFSSVEMDMVLIGSDYDEKIGALLAEMLPQAILSEVAWFQDNSIGTITPDAENPNLATFKPSQTGSTHIYAKAVITIP